MLMINRLVITEDSWAREEKVRTHKSTAWSSTAWIDSLRTPSRAVCKSGFPHFNPTLMPNPNRTLTASFWNLCLAVLEIPQIKFKR